VTADALYGQSLSELPFPGLRGESEARREPVHANAIALDVIQIIN